MQNSAQSQTQQENKVCKIATNAADALNNYDWMLTRIDTLNSKQDSMMKVWEQRIEKMKQEPKKPE